MYDLVDRPVATLPAFERMVLGTMRRWVHALSMAGAPPASGCGDAAFGAAMEALDRGSQEELVIQRPCHDVVEETEAVILSLWRLVRADRLAAARDAANALLDAAHGRLLVGAMVRATPALAG